MRSPIFMSEMIYKSEVKMNVNDKVISIFTPQMHTDVLIISTYFGVHREFCVWS